MTNTRYIDSSKDLKTRFIVEGSTDKENWFMIHDGSENEDDRSHPYIILDEKYEVRYLRVTALELPYGELFALSGLRVFGNGNGECPQKARNITAVRDRNGLDCRIRFDQIENATGCNIRFGIAEDKLYSSCLVYEKNEVLLTSLNAGQDYYFKVDAFNENGITEGDTVYRI